MSDDCLNSGKWISPGLLEEILEEIRSELASRDFLASNQNPPPSQSSSSGNVSSTDNVSMDISSSATYTASWSGGLQVETNTQLEQTLMVIKTSEYGLRVETHGLHVETY